MEKNYSEILNEMLMGNKYYNNEDLRFDRKINILFSNQKLEEFIIFKDEYISNLKTIYPLKSFNSKYIYCYLPKQLKYMHKDYIDLIKNYYEENSSSIVADNYDEIIISRLASELDGTLRIEGVNTTRKVIMDIIKNKEIIKDNNKQIIYNMIKGYEFVLTKPNFNKDNLLKLYNILSYNCLKEDQKIKGYYRSEMVKIGEHEGCPVDKIDECMNSLFDLVNSCSSDSFVLPFIVHYYILYIHPYMDYNGRTARMAALWISLLFENEQILPTYISEAINDDKANYYKAIDYSRNSNNDITYFLIYMYKLANDYFIIYKNVNKIKEELAKIGEALTTSESHYLKRIIANKKRGWFNYKGFIDFANLDITKQGALKILNHFLKLNLLNSRTNSRNEKIFIFNDDFLFYEMR